MSNKIIIITGQTATGKTKLALDYVKKESGQLINGDSRQVYRQLNIISGKDLHLIAGFKTHLFDIKDLKEYFSSYDWSNLATETVDKLLDKNITPVIVGGTYLYLYHLLYGIETEGIEPDWNLRKELETKSVTELQEILKKTSEARFNLLNNSDKNNPRRLMRKIELAKKKIGDDDQYLKFHFKPGLKKRDIEIIGLRYEDRENLRKAIEERVEERTSTGAFKEVEQLVERGYSERDPGMQTIGYQEILKYFSGILSKEEAIYQWTAKEIQYAKRQYTFMKRDPHIKWQSVA